MKKYFQMIGIISLACFSFVFTEKTASVVRDSDELMQTIKEQGKTYEVESINANIEEDVIIPGISGKKVNNNKSYKNMKRLGKFNENLLIYDLILPDVSISKNYNKYIIKGNSKKQMVSLIFKVKENTKANYISSIIKDNNQYNFFIDGKWLENNEEQIKSISKDIYNIGNLSYGGNYSNSDYVWINSVINRYNRQKHNYCYLEEKNDDYLNICASNKSYTILPSIIIKENPLIEVKEQLFSGSIISMEINDKVIKELPLIVSYINSKGYSLVTLDKLLDENV